MIIRELRRTWCKARHRPRSLRAAVVGKGSVACRHCGVGYVDLEHAGALHLHGHERYLSWKRMADLDKDPAPVTAATFAAVEWRVLRGSQQIRKGRAA